MKLTAVHQHRLSVLQLGRELVAEQPPVLVELQTAAALIETNPQMFPTLGCGPERTHSFTCTSRERRLERRRMMARELSVLAAHSDLLTLSNGERINGECKPITERQLGAELGIAPAGDEDLPDHDSTGMRAMRSGLRDLDDGGFISRAQPKVHYCAESIGGCGKKVPRGGTCKCGRRHLWRWRSLPTIITLQRACFEAFGLLEKLREQQAKRYEEQQAAGPTAKRDIIQEREQRRRMRHHHRRTAAAGIESSHDPELVARQHEQLERIYGRKRE